MSEYLVLPTRRDIKAARNYMEWKQIELGAKCGVTEYAINSIETQRHHPKKELLDKIASCRGKFPICRTLSSTTSRLKIIPNP